MKNLTACLFYTYFSFNKSKNQGLNNGQPLQDHAMSVPSKAKENCDTKNSIEQPSRSNNHVDKVCTMLQKLSKCEVNVSLC